MEAPSLVYFHPEHRVLLCLPCCAGIPPDNVASHFRKVHHTKSEELQRILEYSWGFPSAENPHTIALPAEGSTPVEQLSLLDGFRCGDCPYLTISRKKLQIHRRVEDHRGDWAEAALQSFSQGRYARYWIVTPPPGHGARVAEEDENGGARETEAGGPERDKRWAQLLSGYATQLAEEEAVRRRTIDGTPGVDLESTWVAEIGWARHLHGKDMVELYQAGSGAVSAAVYRNVQDEAVRNEQQQLMRLGESFDREIARCSARLRLVPHETRRWLAGIDPNRPAGRPFGLKQEVSSMKRYQLYWKRYLSYCLRAYKLGRAEAADQRMVRFSDPQWEALAQVVHQLDRQAQPTSERTSPDREQEGGGWDGDFDSEDSDEDSDEDRHEDSIVDHEPVGERVRGPGDLGDTRSADEVQLDQAVFRFCIVTLKQKVAVDLFANPLLHFTAVLGIDGPRLAWRPARHATGQLAGIMWCGRVLMLEHIFEAEDPEAANDMQPAAVEHFLSEFRTWLADGTGTPFSAMIRWMAYGKGHRKQEGGLPRVMWEAGGEALRYMGQRIPIDTLRRTVQADIATTEALLDGLLFGDWGASGAAMTLADIADSLLFEGPGQSFATNERNGWLRPGHQKIAALARYRLWDKRRGRWQSHAVKAWLAQLQTFRGALLRNTHIWAGQPGRGPEIMTVRHCDTARTTRNVFVFEGEVLLVTDRDKAKAIRGLGRKVARFLPARLGKMLVAYIAWLLPFEAMLSAVAGARGPSASLAPWLWKDGRKGRWETEVLSKQLAEATRAGLGVALTASGYRHVAIELGRQIRGLVVRQVELAMGEPVDADHPAGVEDEATGEARDAKRLEYVWDLQATHSSAIARQHYAVHVLFPGQLQPQMLANYREISRLWHAFLGRAVPDGHADAARDAPTTPAPGTTPKRQGAPLSTTERGKRRRAADELDRASSPPASSPPAGRQGSLDRRIDTGLRQLLGNQAGWRMEEQREGMRRIMAMRAGEVLVVVLPTGGGKSILFMLPAVPLMNAGVSIVVVPFVALMDDLAARAQAFGLDCLRWVPSDQAGRDGAARVARLVVVSADQANGAEFVSYASRLRAQGLLRRIFVDEGHTIIMDAGYRARLAELRGLYRYDCPVVLLTATLPVRMEGWFRRTMVAEDAVLVRARTVKKNIRYRVVTVAPGKGKPVEAEVVRRVVQLSGRMQGDEKGVVYCRSKTKCEALAGQIGCGFYHSGVEAAVRRATLEGWTRGAEGQRWIVATTGLGTGVDIAGIVAVVHAEQPYGLVDFVQQTGRGGRRAGETVDSIVVLDGRPPWHDPHASDVDQLNREAMALFVQTPGCRRLVLGSFMDGLAQDCDGAGAERCDRCQGRRSLDAAETGGEGGGAGREVAAPANRLQEDNRAQQRRVRALLGWLEQVEGGCGVCYVVWHQKGRQAGQARRHRHRPGACRHIPKKAYMAWRRRLSFAEFACCWLCGLPQAWCARAETAARQEDVEAGCRWMDLVLPAVQLVEKSASLRASVEEAFGVTVGESGFRGWLGRSRTMYGLPMTNALAIWDHIVHTICL